MPASDDELEGCWDMPMVLAWVGGSRQNLYKKMGAGQWPRPCAKRGNRVGWRAAVVAAALEKTTPKS